MFQRRRAGYSDATNDTPDNNDPEILGNTKFVYCVVLTAEKRLSKNVYFVRTAVSITYRQLTRMNGVVICCCHDVTTERILTAATLKEKRHVFFLRYALLCAWLKYSYVRV